MSCNVLSQYDDITVILGPGLWSTFSLTGRYCWQTSPEVTLPRYLPPLAHHPPPSPHPPPGLIRPDDNMMAIIFQTPDIAGVLI